MKYTDKYNLAVFKHNISIYNKLSDNMLNDFDEAVQFSMKFNQFVEKNKKLYGDKINVSEIKENYKEKTKFFELQNEKLNNGLVFSAIASFVCELCLKYLIVKNQKKFSHTHNLNNLYNCLDISEKDEIKKKTMKKCIFLSEEDYYN